MLMALGPFRFTVPTFPVDALSRRATSRVADQEVIGAAPVTHLLGPGPEEISLRTTFYPLQLNRAGGLMLIAIREAMRAQTPLMFLHVFGPVLGRYVITGVDNDEDTYSAIGVAQKVDATLSLKKYVPRGGDLTAGLF